MKLKELREEIGLTQTELAKQIGTSQKNISNWENGASQPDIQTICRLADIFAVTTDELLGHGELNFGHSAHATSENDYSHKIMKETSMLTLSQRKALLAFLETLNKEK